MRDFKEYPLSKPSVAVLKKICYEINGNPKNSMEVLENTFIMIEYRIMELQEMKAKNTLSDNDVLFLNILLVMKKELYMIWNAASKAFEDADEIFGSLQDAYFAESIRECAFEDYLDDLGELKTVGGKAA